MGEVVYKLVFESERPAEVEAFESLFRDFLGNWRDHPDDDCFFMSSCHKGDVTHWEVRSETRHFIEQLHKMVEREGFESKLISEPSPAVRQPGAEPAVAASA
jgi:hypothetical protein|tara:strand:+ start:191 stop:496 length:306 start_codon:yes stop_codon:yes gene_type:complete